MASATSTPWLLRDTTPASRSGSAASTPARSAASYTATPSRGSFTSAPSRTGGSFTSPPGRTGGSFTSPPARAPGSFSAAPPRSPATGALASPPTSPTPAPGSTHVRSPSGGAGVSHVRSPSGGHVRSPSGGTGISHVRSPSGGAGMTTPRTAVAPAVPPRLTLICFPPSGTGAGVYFGWQCRLPPGVEMLAVELPARASRMKDAPIDSMRQLMDEMLPELLPILRERPFVFFGHSMGSWLAYQATQELVRRGWPLPLKVFISANRSPLLAGPEHDLSKTLMHRLPEEKFWEEMKVRYGDNQNMEHPAVRKLMLPMMMADYKLMETWEPWGHDAQQQQQTNGSAAGTAAPAPAPASPQHQAACCSCFGMGQPQGAPPGMVLPCPLAAFGAEYDNRLTKKQLSAWVHVAPPGQYEEIWFRGGHTYATYDGPGRQAMLSWLGDDLVRIMEELDQEPPASENGQAFAAAGTAAAAAGAASPEQQQVAQAAAANGGAAASPAAPALASWLAQAEAAEPQAEAARKSSAAEIAVEEEHAAAPSAAAAQAPKPAVAERRASGSKEQAQEAPPARSGFCSAFTCCFG
ncbi:gramicidin biosynthesis [Chlorella sorokiniana]|uniref:Gramicidin biosynthesis n=1 Tax=Chlorella sorokiniana TaxID=3076 RepID=A0A2P6TCH1_CHLSO|nr:gramicidin biosynthesis [Chlorella sorokiniana]|eukprot:PRW20337.1 gramicidin biosynthesis [Chlorella sorokiniana]